MVFVISLRFNCTGGKMAHNFSMFHPFAHCLPAVRSGANALHNTRRDQFFFSHFCRRKEHWLIASLVWCWKSQPHRHGLSSRHGLIQKLKRLFFDFLKWCWNKKLHDLFSESKSIYRNARLEFMGHVLLTEISFCSNFLKWTIFRTLISSICMPDFLLGRVAGSLGGQKTPQYVW